MNVLTRMVAPGLLAFGVTVSNAAEQLDADAMTDAVEVVQLETNQPGYGSVVVVGELQSDTDRLLERIQIALIVRDSNGEELGREGAQVLLLAPDDKAPFRLVFKEQSYPGWDHVEPLVWRARSHPGESTPVVEVSIDREIPDPSGSSYVHEVQGSITNSDDVALEWVEVDAAFYDGDDRLIAVGHDSVVASLGQGESENFSIGINTAAGEVARVEARGYAKPVER